MTQMRNITTAMFATANGHIGKGASVSDTFKYLFDDLIGKTKNPKELQKMLEEALENGAIDYIYNCTRTSTNDTRAYGFIKSVGGKTLLHKVQLRINI